MTTAPDEEGHAARFEKYVIGTPAELEKERAAAVENARKAYELMLSAPRTGRNPPKAKTPS